MITKEEWAKYEIERYLHEVKNEREKNGTNIKDANEIICKILFKETGIKIDEISHLWHHRDWLLGENCKKCGKPYRTKQARYCVECGFDIEII